MRASVKQELEIRRPGYPEVRTCVGIVGLCVGMAMVYGVIHDLITAHVCVEYFTIGHEDIFGTENPIVLACGWGVVATWYVGAVIAIPLICAARLGEAVPWGPRELFRPVLILLGIMALAAFSAGVIGWWIGRTWNMSLPGVFGDLVPREHQIPFIAVWCAHTVSYFVGFIGGMVLPVVVWQRRQRRVA